MYRDIIKTRFEAGRFDPHHFKQLAIDIQNDIAEKTAFLPTTCSLAERIYCYGNNISSKPRCKSCKNDVIFPFWLTKAKQKYRIYCSNKCSNNCTIVKEKKKTVCQNHYGVDNPSKSDIIKNKKSVTVHRNFGGWGFASKETNKKIHSTIFEKYKVNEIKLIPGWRDKLIARISQKPWYVQSKEADNFIAKFLKINKISANRCMFGNNEFFIKHKRGKNNGIYFYDLVVFATEEDMKNRNQEKISLILEYDGSFWHPSIDQSITFRSKNFGITKIPTRERYLQDKHKEYVAKQLCPNFIRIRLENNKILP
jgi:hypothetical protein